MNIMMLLTVRYEGIPIISLEKIREDFFSHLGSAQFQMKLLKGEIPIPVVQLDPTSRKSLKGILLTDLAAYLDERIRIAKKELAQMMA